MNDRRTRNLPVEQDRRCQDRRSAFRTSVNIWVEEATDEARYLHYSTNISARGIFLEKRLPLPLDTEVQLEINLPGGEEKLRVKGVVANLRIEDEGEDFRGMGIRFLALDEDQEKQIAILLSQLRASRGVA
ncbi:MAG: hypothetical protein A2284_04825 [Deltaproteobacteria bacterium RIFOXYA12_FULL_61_11]|nr:MAG: hypothetical protein A2284_04825 [Deltaproteobacteria bacterium RIFOXYA12_FULL_61_11]